MCVLYLAPLLALLSVGTAVPAPKDCGHLVKLLAPEDQHNVFGEWIFIEGFSDHEMFNAILRKTNSSWIEILPTSHTETVLLNQGNLIDGKCLGSSVNMTFSKNILQISQNNVTSTGRFLLSCPDCLVMDFNSTMDEVHIRSLYIFGKTRTLLEAELKQFRKQAECLQYPQPAQYSYDGVTEFCAEKKESSHIVASQDEKDGSQ
ncbi:saxitoxin and tetrodotoxin-binding protein 2 [Salmo trutta]|uniref:Saxitoxin and tetrodotoxin-binding protein 2-like n=1 Tax=Salmo trutta TaxID=8032 RepID=A0A673YW12_SALTR|nr:saxitoxin and tetrodotoxin-binding protein 2-like [Salmo trutta]